MLIGQIFLKTRPQHQQYVCFDELCSRDTFHCCFLVWAPNTLNTGTKYCLLASSKDIDECCLSAFMSQILALSNVTASCKLVVCVCLCVRCMLYATSHACVCVMRVQRAELCWVAGERFELLAAVLWG